MAPENSKTPAGGDDFEAAARLVDTRDLLAPCTSEEAAALLKMKPGTLKNLRCAGNGPPGWVHVPGIGGRYRSKLDVLRWWWEQHRQATLEPSARRAA
jgi:hypothetical protein